MNNSSVENVVMRRVHRLHVLQKVFSLPPAYCLLLAASLWALGRQVWVARVFENMPQGDLAALSQFFLSAFSRTELMVQALTVLTILSLIYLARLTAWWFASVFTTVPV